MTFNVTVQTSASTSVLVPYSPRNCVANSRSEPCSRSRRSMSSCTRDVSQDIRQMFENPAAANTAAPEPPAVTVRSDAFGGDEILELPSLDPIVPPGPPHLNNVLEIDGPAADAASAGAPAVVPGLPVVDTMKVVDADGLVVHTPDRSSVRAIQTPQGFTRAALDRAHASGQLATDDAALAEACGIPVRVVDGDPLALKVTTPADLDHATRLLEARR